MNVRRRGLTLIELVVVLMILVILGGLIVSNLPAVTKRAHLAKCADTIPALNNAWNQSYALNVRYPDACDSLLDSSGTAHPLLTPGLRSQTSPTNLTAADMAGLSAVGVTRVVDLRTVNVASGENATYDATPNSGPLAVSPRMLAAGGSVCELNAAAHIAAGNALNLKRHINYDGSTNTNVRYLIFGVGPHCTAVGTGKLIAEAPVHFAADDSINPTKVYQRYLVVLALTTTPSTGLVTASFESAAGNDTLGPSSAGDHIRQFHESANKD